MGFGLRVGARDGGKPAEANELHAIYFLRRLGRLIQLRQAAAVASRSGLLSTLDHAIYSTYLDLRTLGWEGEARQLMRAEHPGD